MSEITSVQLTDYAFDFDMETGEGLDLAKYAAAPSGGSYSPTEPGFYLAVVQSVTASNYTSKAGDNIFKIRPAVTLFNADRTQINRQDLTIGARNEKGWYRPDGDLKKSPIWQGPTGALSFLVAVGIVPAGGDRIKGAFNVGHIINRIVTVNVGLAAWADGQKELQPKDLRQTIAQVTGSEPKTLQEHQEGLALLNDSLGFVTDEDGKRPKGAWNLKNFIIGYYIPNDKAIDQFNDSAEEPLLVDLSDGAKRVFLNEDAFDTYKGLVSGKIKIAPNVAPAAKTGAAASQAPAKPAAPKQKAKNL